MWWRLPSLMTFYVDFLLSALSLHNWYFMLHFIAPSEFHMGNFRVILFKQEWGLFQRVFAVVVHKKCTLHFICILYIYPNTTPHTYMYIYIYTECWISRTWIYVMHKISFNFAFFSHSSFPSTRIWMPFYLP